MLLAGTVLGVGIGIYPWGFSATDYWESIDLSRLTLLALDVLALYWLFTGAGAKWFEGQGESTPGSNTVRTIHSALVATAPAIAQFVLLPRLDDMRADLGSSIPCRAARNTPRPPASRHSA